MGALTKTFDFNGAAVTAFTFRGRECWIAQDVARVLGYDPKGWSTSWRRWVESDELREPSEFQVLRGQDLREFKALLDVTAETAVSRTPNLTILYESGLNAVCLLTEKPMGKQLRRFVAETVLPDLRRRSANAQALHDEIVALNLRLNPATATAIWERDTVQDICRLYRKEVWEPPARMPMWLKEPMGRIYRIVLGDTVYRELKSRNPDPKDGSLNYQFLTEARHRLMLKDMGIVSALIRTSNTREEFFAKLQHQYRRTPLQLGW